MSHFVTVCQPQMRDKMRRTEKLTQYVHSTAMLQNQGLAFTYGVFGAAGPVASMNTVFAMELWDCGTS